MTDLVIKGGNSSTVVTEMITRFPNLEVGFWGGALDYPGLGQSIRQAFNISPDNLTWKFISTNGQRQTSQEGLFDAAQRDLIEIALGRLYFDTGGKDLDHHGIEANQPIGKRCALDLVRDRYDFVAAYPWIEPVFEKVRDNDIEGKRISFHSHNLRELMTGLTVVCDQSPKIVLDWLTLAFCGIFLLREQNDFGIKKIFNPEMLIAGVGKYDPTRLEWFKDLLESSRNRLSAEWEEATTAVGKAERFKNPKGQGWTAEIYVKSLNQKVKVISVISDSTATAKAARSKKYDLVIQWNTDGHCQIHSSKMFDGDGEVVTAKKEIHLGRLAARLRELEAVFNGRTIKSGQDWQKSCTINYSNGVSIPWFLGEYRTGLYNGTLSSSDAPITKFKPGRLLAVVCEVLPFCGALIDHCDGKDKQIIEGPPLPARWRH